MVSNFSINKVDYLHACYRTPPTSDPP